MKVLTNITSSMSGFVFKKSQSLPQKGGQTTANRNNRKTHKHDKLGNKHTLAFINTICFTLERRPKDKQTRFFLTRNTPQIDLSPDSVGRCFFAWPPEPNQFLTASTG